MSLLAAMPGFGSSVADATLTDQARSALVLASVNASNPARHVVTRLAPDTAPLVRMVRLNAPDAFEGFATIPGGLMWLHDAMPDDTLQSETSQEVDLSHLHAMWLGAFAPTASARPQTRSVGLTTDAPGQAAANLSTSGALAAPFTPVLPERAVQVSLVPRPRPEGLSRRVVQYSRDWLRRIPLRAPTEQETCLATAIYHEARGEALKGQFAVAEVILNRVASRKFPGTICGVVFQGVKAGRYGGCQFSFACDTKPDALRNSASADIARRIAQVMADGGHRGLTSGALYFHTTAVNPSWSRRFVQTTQIGAHLFYRG